VLQDIDVHAKVSKLHVKVKPDDVKVRIFDIRVVQQLNETQLCSIWTNREPWYLERIQNS
jgi:hypothetical protein